MAASRTLRVPIEFLRSLSRWSRKSRISCDVRVFERDLARPDARSAGDEADQQHEAVGVARHGVAAGVARVGQVLPKERAEMGSERDHASILPR